jgi:hypothetical protein
LPKRTKEDERGDSFGDAVRRALPSLLPAFSSSFGSFGYQLSLGGRTRRSSEREPVGTPGGVAAALGGWLPSLTLSFDYLTKTTKIAIGLRSPLSIPARSPNQK